MIVEAGCVLLALDCGLIRLIDDALCLSCIFGCDEAAVANPKRTKPIRILGLHSILRLVSLIKESRSAIIHIDGIGEIERVAFLALILNGAHHSLVVLPQFEQNPHGMLRFAGKFRRTSFIHFIYISHSIIQPL